ncbi:T9SS type B sorting domain-containing protein [Pseudotamlana carrageenivorans]|uniref:Ig-like domain-containing protein n=1 Tax=Pseudotamlana carrageenivorans TaxID=2069432 RepID=A0A2I7SDM9_9FLAO|nr:T9SS type B sorting domain-containing protein [Tamlana carrageenivorans]AUS03998.1 hypothetical protein C1A40_00190 [Tamlana carrageenivorans]
MRFGNIIIFSFLFCFNYAFSQRISVNDSVDLTSLIQDNFVDGCVDISNINSPVNGTVSGISSYAYFERGNSNFPFKNGIMLSTGGAATGGNNLITSTLSEGSSTWGTDPDLEAALGTTNSFLNATAIEFDFISISNKFEFNYILASEEYFNIYPCHFSDGFVFLIKEAETSEPYQNIAVIPGTTTPVSTKTIRDEIFGVCPAQNEVYFDGYNIGDTNYNGRTTVLTASGDIKPYVKYHIKLIIADQDNSGYDSAVFIEGDHFSVLELGADISTCTASAEVNADIQNPLASYAWYLNNSLIPGATNPTYTATQNGTYRVEVSIPVDDSSCVEHDEITIVLNTEEPMEPIPNSELCDDPSRDQIEVFDLSIKNSEVSANSPFTNFTYSYHYTESEARSNTNAITSPISNTTNPQTIYVRVNDLDNNCLTYSNFELIVNEPQEITTPTLLEVCESDDIPDGFTFIDLTQKNDEITGGNSDLEVSYHYSSSDATTGNNPIENRYINTNTPNDLVYVRVVNANTKCINTTTLNIHVQVGPKVVTETQYIDAFDFDLDGHSFFNLTEVIDKILNGLTGVSTSFYEDYDDAMSATNPITNVTNYAYTNGSSEPGHNIIFLRVQDHTTGCATVVPFEIHTNLLLTGTRVDYYTICDTNTDTTDAADFNLLNIETEIINDLPYPITVTFYETEEDRTNGNSLDKNETFTAYNQQTIFVTMSYDDRKQDTKIILLINPILLFNSPPITYCDTDDDGITSIDLESIDYTITGSNENFTVSYFNNETDAETNNIINQLPRYITNTSPLTTLYARVNIIGDSICYTVNKFKIEVLTAPSTTKASNEVICDNDQDGFSIINLNSKISEIVPSTTGLEIDFFTSLNDAQNKTNEISESDREAFNTNTQTIYARVEDVLGGTSCFSIETFEVIVNTLPNTPEISNYQICESTGVYVSNFYLNEKDSEILNGQNGKEVFYFEDAERRILLDKSAPYQNTSNPQTIYVRVENLTDPTCFSEASFLLEVSPKPIYNPVIPYLVCDDKSNDGKYEFNFDEKANEIRQGIVSDNLNISFHESRNDADTNSNPLPSLYTNKTNPQSIYVRIESENTLCHIVEELGINIIAAPNITDTTPLIHCDTDYDGISTFDLTSANFQLLDRIKSNLSVNYFDELSKINQSDVLDNSNEITDPTNYISGTKTVYIRVANTSTGCFIINTLELIVNIPPAINSITTYEICDNDTDTFDLTTLNNVLVNNTSEVNISFHNTQNDADTNSAALSNIFNYTSNRHTLFTRVSNLSTGCYTTHAFNLVINPNPIANTPPDLISCDDDFDGLYTFDLSLNTPSILRAQSPNLYTVTYYKMLSDAEEKINSLSPIYAAYDGETFYARTENNNTGCYSTTQFNAVVHPLPVIPIDDIVLLCRENLPLYIDASTGDTNDTYYWSTPINATVDNSTSSQIAVNPEQLGTYSVTVTTPNNCQFNKTFTVIESEQAEIEFTSKIDFSDPNNITVNINTERIGNYVFILDGGEPQTSNTFENISFGNHSITVRDLNGCMDAYQEVFVFDIPKFFTPNNDSYYDTWHIIGAEQLAGSIVYIYNRFGQLLKTLRHSSPGWNGTFNGENMPTDDYWYVAKIIQNGNEMEIKGHFTLKR